MKYPGWELDAELEGEYQRLLNEGVSEELSLQLTNIQKEVIFEDKNTRAGM